MTQPTKADTNKRVVDMFNDSKILKLGLDAEDEIVHDLRKAMKAQTTATKGVTWNLEHLSLTSMVDISTLFNRLERKLSPKITKSKFSQ